MTELVAAARQAIRVPYTQPPIMPDPLVPAVETLRDGMAGTLPAHLAAQYILGLFSQLADQDKSAVARLILQPPSTPPMPNAGQAR